MTERSITTNMFKFAVFATLVTVASAGVFGPTRRIGSSPIVGGTATSIEDAPWQVALQYNGELRCGGSIITSKVILTGAHCAIGTVVGSWNVRAGSSQHAYGGTSYKVSRVVIHPQYDVFTHDYDFSVLILSATIAMDNLDTIKIIPLPALNQIVPDGSSALVTGWGSAVFQGSIEVTLRKVNLPVVNQAVCENAYKNGYPITARMICGGRPGVGGMDACQGDSGGPFVVDGVIIGVTSWGLGCGDYKYPGVWARVPAVIGWLQDQL